MHFRRPTEINEFVRFEEPLRETFTRTFLIAALVATVAGFSTGSGRIWAATFSGALWFSFVGHWVELLWLESVRTRIKRERFVQFSARISYWFAWGIPLGWLSISTANFVDPTRSRRFDPISSGLSLVVVELTVHALFLAIRRRPSVYDGRG